MALRPYQQEARDAILNQWRSGVRATLLVLPTGTGKTIVFSQVIADVVREGGNVLVLAHREELLNQAADKLFRSTGLRSDLEKAESTSVNGWYSVVVGSVQTLQNENRLKRFAPDFFSAIVVDEAHHAVSASYRRVLDYFTGAKILGVTATADRGDKRNLGEVFETLAYEYSLPRAIHDGYLSPIKAQTIPLNINLAGVKIQSGDFQAAALGSALEPYLDRIAAEMAKICQNRKTVVFLPLIATSQHMAALLRQHGLTAAEVNGMSEDRKEILNDFHNGKYQVLCNSMLLTEGWDEPAVDCIVCLRPTKVRALYAQIVGRGTRLSPGKTELLLLDFLWQTEQHNLCRPAHLVCKNEEYAARVAEILVEQSQDGSVDLLEAEAGAESTAKEEREEALRKALEEQKAKKRRLVDPLQYEMAVSTDGKIKEYQPDPHNLHALVPPSEKQLAALELAGINPEYVTCSGHASMLLDTLAKRRNAGLTSPKQIRLLENYGFRNVGSWTRDEGIAMTNRIKASGWKIPHGVNPATFNVKEL